MTQGVTRRNQHTYTLTILVTPMNPGRLGIYGGTFNPIHTGHLIIAQEIYEQCKLDRLLFIPSARPPHKHHANITSPGHRYQMVERLVRDPPGPFSTSVATHGKPSRSNLMDNWFRQLLLHHP